MYVSVCVCACVCLYRYSHVYTNNIAENDWFEFSFPSPGLVAIPMLKRSVCPTFYPYLRKKRWISTFPKGTSSLWNANSPVQILNSSICFYFLRRYNAKADLCSARYIYIYIYMCVCVCVCVCVCPKINCLLSMTLNCIRCWDTSYAALGSMTSSPCCHFYQVHNNP